MADFDLSTVSRTLDELLSKTDLSKTTEEGASFDLPDGYYLCEVKKSEFTATKSTGNPMIAFEYLTIEDGKKTIVDEQGYAQLVDAPKTANKKIFQNYVLSNEMNLGFFVSDMLKFQDPDTNESLFDKETDFKTTKDIVRVCDSLVETGMIIYIMVQTTKRKNLQTGEEEKVKKYNPISWNRARRLGLLED